MNMRLKRVDAGPGPRPATVLRLTLPGEYLALGCMAFALLGAIRWGLALPETVLALGQILASAWIFTRATGLLGGGWLTAIASSAVVVLQVLALLVGQDDPPEARWPRGPFSPMGYLIVGLMLLGIEFADIGRQLLSAGSRSVAQNLHRAVRLVSVVVGGAFLVYMVVLPIAASLLEQLWPGARVTLVDDMTLAESIRLKTTEAFCACMFAFLGGTIGSFLNVVAWRLPRGESVVVRRSRCPACGTAILPRDNLPVVGWVLLRGRCRSCQQAISGRYPAVELLMTGVFLVLYSRELLSGGANLPVRTPNLYTGVVWIIFYTKWDLIALYLFHGFLLSVLVAWGLIEHDGHRVPMRSLLLLPALALLLIIAAPVLQLVPAVPGWNLAHGVGPGLRIATALLGGAAGLSLGWLIALIETRRRSVATRQPFAWEPVAGLSLMGIGLGWQGAVAVALLWISLRTVRGTLGDQMPQSLRWGLTADLALAAFVHQLVWRNLIESLGSAWPGPETTSIPWIAVAVVSTWLILPGFRPVGVIRTCDER